MSFLGWGDKPMYSNANPNYVNPTSSNNPANFGSNEISGLNSPPYYPQAFYGVKSNVYAASGHATVKGGAASRKCVGGKKGSGCCGTSTLNLWTSKSPKTRRLISHKGNSYQAIEIADGVKRKIKNIVKVYKMKGKKTIKNIKNSIKNLFSGRKSRFLAGGKYKKRTVKNRTRSRRHRVRHRKLRGGYSQYQNNLPMTQVYSLGGDLPASESALASPPPYTALSNCVNCVDNYNHYTNSGFPSRGH